MSKNSIISNAVALVNYIYEGEGIMETNDVIKHKVENWYNHTDLCDAEMLAAASMLGDYSSSITYTQIRDLAENCFPEFFFSFALVGHADEYSIGDYEDSYRDFMWR